MEIFSHAKQVVVRYNKSYGKPQRIISGIYVAALIVT